MGRACEGVAPRTLVLLVLESLQIHPAYRARRVDEVDSVVQVKPRGKQDRPNGDRLGHARTSTRTNGCADNHNEDKPERARWERTSRGGITTS